MQYVIQHDILFDIISNERENCKLSYDVAQKLTEILNGIVVLEAVKKTPHCYSLLFVTANNQF